MQGLLFSVFLVNFWAPLSLSMSPLYSLFLRGWPVFSIASTPSSRGGAHNDFTNDLSLVQSFASGYVKDH